MLHKIHVTLSSQRSKQEKRPFPGGKFPGNPFPFLKCATLIITTHNPITWHGYWIVVAVGLLHEEELKFGGSFGSFATHGRHYLLMHSAFAREASFHKRYDLVEDVFNFQIKVSAVAVAKVVLVATTFLHWKG